MKAHDPGAAPPPADPPCPRARVLWLSLFMLRHSPHYLDAFPCPREHESRSTPTWLLCPLKKKSTQTMGYHSYCMAFCLGTVYDLIHFFI
ncbi:hypothetical protein BX666DRAFT_1512166 [Dichotomocladium elegans]|nr:hypothetical protein BX666DRAFT_1512166 [Dichotomocladium elegans]